MAHEIEHYDGIALGSGEAAWHGLGTVVQGAMTSEEALTLAKLNWTVGMDQLYLHSISQPAMKVNGWFATVREDLTFDNPARVLGCVRSRYHPIQNSESFAIADGMLGEGCRFETAGSIRNGKVTWILARQPKDTVVKDDRIGQYLLLTNSHDGSRSMRILFTPIRVVCSNTLHAALYGSKGQAKITHTRGAAQQIAEARRILGLSSAYFTRFGVVAQSLADYRVNSRFVTAYTESLWPKSDDAKRTDKANDRARERVIALFRGEQHGGAMDAVRDTAWGLLNAVTEFVDHSEPKRIGKQCDKLEASFERCLLTGGAVFKQRALDIMLDRTGMSKLAQSTKSPATTAAMLN